MVVLGGGGSYTVMCYQILVLFVISKLPESFSFSFLGSPNVLSVELHGVNPFFMAEKQRFFQVNTKSKIRRVAVCSMSFGATGSLSTILILYGMLQVTKGLHFDFHFVGDKQTTIQKSLL